jgi:hypothetical protein
MNAQPPRPVIGNAAAISKDTRGWFLGHFIPGEDNLLRNAGVEIKWFTHAKGKRLRPTTEVGRRPHAEITPAGDTRSRSTPARWQPST